MSQHFIFEELEQERRMATPPFYSVSVINIDEACDWEPIYCGISKWEIRDSLRVLRDMGYDNESIRVSRDGNELEVARQDRERDAKFTNVRKRDR